MQVNGPHNPPETNRGPVFCAINQTTAGVYLSIWSFQAAVWVRLLNRYHDYPSAQRAIEGYGWIHWAGPAPPHKRDLRRTA